MQAGNLYPGSDEGLSPEGTYRGDNAYPLEGRSLVLLQKVSPA